MSGKKKIVHLPKNSEMREYLEDNGVPHLQTMTTATTYLETDDVKFILADDKIPNKDLNFIARTKKFAMNTRKEDTKLTVENVTYFRYNQILPGTYKDVIELDVNGAYWEIAKMLGYISEKIYLEGLGKSKKTRLVALGSLASVKRKFYFDGEKHIRLGDEKNDITRSYWFHISKTLGDYMDEAINELGGQAFYFFWVDAFFVRKSAENKLRKIFEKNGLVLKSKIIESMFVEKMNKCETKFHLSVKKKTREDSTEIHIKPFHFVNKELKKERNIIEFKNRILKSHT